MAKKTRKQKQRSPARRGPAPGPSPRTASPAVPIATRLPTVPDALLPIPDDSEGTEPEVSTGNGAAHTAAQDASAATDGSSRRRVQRVNPVAQPRSGSRQVSTAAMFLPLDSDDAAIPFDRVPYVPRDLRRVAIMASLMIVLILIAAFVVTRINP